VEWFFTIYFSAWTARSDPNGLGLAQTFTSETRKSPKSPRLQILKQTSKECAHCHAIKNKIKNHSVDKVKK